MEFLKRHYEKLILSALLVVFMSTMFYVLNIIQDTKKVADIKLKIKPRSADHVVADTKDPKLNPRTFWESTSCTWDVSKARKMSNASHFSDLVSIFPMARCPFCNKIIPSYYFKERRCPIPGCGKLLRTPPERPKYRIFVKSENDLDGDGISNEDEKKYGLDEKNPDDALADKDKDGFSNLYEIQNGFDPTNPASHPPLWYRLRVVAVKQVPLPIKFMVLNTRDSKKMEDWVLYFNVPSHNKRKKTDDTLFRKLGATVQIEKRNYRIVKIERIIKKAHIKEDPNRNESTAKVAQRNIDKSKVYLEEVVSGDKTPDKLEMVRDQIVYSSDKRPILEDVGSQVNKQQYTLRIGDSFRMGNRATRFSTYQVVSVDAKKMQVTLDEPQRKEKKQGDKPMIVTREGEIPEDMRVVEAPAVSNAGMED